MIDDPGVARSDGRRAPAQRGGRRERGAAGEQLAPAQPLRTALQNVVD